MEFKWGLGVGGAAQRTDMIFKVTTMMSYSLKCFVSVGNKINETIWIPKHKERPQNYR